jgi:glycosyltransferase involved in cell wall biosynthesis
VTSNSPGGSPLGLAHATHRVAAQKDGPLRIVAHNGAAVWGGAEINLTHLLSGLQRRGHQVTLCCNHEVVADRAARQLVPTIIRPLRGDLMFGDALSFARFLEQEKPDALVLGTFKKIWLGGWAARRARVPRTVARVGLASDTPRRWKYRHALEHWVDLVTLNADAMRAAFLRDGPRIDPSRVLTVYHGVEPPRRRAVAGTVRTQLGITFGVRVIGTVCRLSRQKRLERLLAVTEQLPDVHCVIAGEGSERVPLEEEIARRGLQQRVHLLGFRDDVGDVLSSLDVFILTSDQEGMSNSMLEAMSLGIPVVSTPVSGAHEALEPLADGRIPGRVVQSFEPADIVAALHEFLERSEVRGRAGAAAAERARERFSYERMVTDFETLLRRGLINVSS